MPHTKPKRDKRTGYWPYLLPGLIVFLLIIAIPFILNLWYSLHAWKGGKSKMRWVGLRNYIDLMSDSSFWRSFTNSVAMIIAMVVIPTLIGLILAAVLFDYVGKHWGIPKQW